MQFDADDLMPEMRFELERVTNKQCIRCKCELNNADAFVLNKYEKGRRLPPSENMIYCLDCYTEYLVTGE